MSTQLFFFLVQATLAFEAADLSTGVSIFLVNITQFGVYPKKGEHPKKGGIPSKKGIPQKKVFLIKQKS
jgi:hypothetical protein